MKLFQDRLWLALLGVAVAIVVTLTTIYWNEPSTSSAGPDGSGKPTTQRALVPKITSKVLNVFRPAVPIKK